MTFQDSIKVCFTKYAEFKGTASRSEYWWFILFLFIVGVVLSAIGPLVSGLFTLGTLVPSIAAATRRLHDTQRSGWWQLVVFVPVLGWILLIVFLAQEGKTGTVQA